MKPSSRHYNREAGVHRDHGDLIKLDLQAEICL